MNDVYDQMNNKGRIDRRFFSGFDLSNSAIAQKDFFENPNRLPYGFSYTEDSDVSSSVQETSHNLKLGWDL